jgi:hypothetical protein
LSRLFYRSRVAFTVETCVLLEGPFVCCPLGCSHVLLLVSSELMTKLNRVKPSRFGLITSRTNSRACGWCKDRCRDVTVVTTSQSPSGGRPSDPVPVPPTKLIPTRHSTQKMKCVVHTHASTYTTYPSHVTLYTNQRSPINAAGVFHAPTKKIDHGHAKEKRSTKVF